MGFRLNSRFNHPITFQLIERLLQTAWAPDAFDTLVVLVGSMVYVHQRMAARNHVCCRRLC